jgi:hypothetical protein
MHLTAARFTLFLVVGLCLPARGQADPKATKSSTALAPLYRISFERKDAVAGIDASPAIKLPFECTSDGTAFVTMVPIGGQVHPPLYAPPPLLLTSVSPSGHANTFPLDQATEQLYDVREVDHYVSDSSVIFLIKAASENKPTKQTYSKPDGSEAEFTKNIAERHFYIVTFDRDGEHQKTIKIDDAFQIQRLGIFPSGAFLVFGYDEKNHSPQLAMLKDDGTLLRTLQIPRGDAPESLLGTKDGSGKGSAVYVAPTQFVPKGQSIVIVQNKTTFPLLEVNEGGAITAIPIKLPQGTQIDALIPSEHNFYARVNPISDGSIYEIIAQEGTVLRRFALNDGRDSAGVACVHDGKFLSFDHGDGKLVPLIGTAEPAVNPASAP